MKKLLALALVASGVAAMSGCKKDNSELIVGTWVNTAETYEEYIENGQSDKEYYPAGQATITFNENGKVTISAQSEGDVEEMDSWTDTYQVNGDNLIWDGETFVIKQLDKKKLVFEMDETETYEGENGPVTGRYVMHFDFNRK